QQTSASIARTLPTFRGDSERAPPERRREIRAPSTQYFRPRYARGFSPVASASVSRCKAGSPRAAGNVGAQADAIRAATFHSQTQSQGCALPDGDISRKTSTRTRRGIARKRRETATAARRQRLIRRDRGGKRQNRALRRWIGFSEDDERVRRTRSTFGAGRVDLPATA